jgi:hypothetical protein
MSEENVEREQTPGVDKPPATADQRQGDLADEEPMVNQPAEAPTNAPANPPQPPEPDTEEEEPEEEQEA